MIWPIYLVPMTQTKSRDHTNMNALEIMQRPQRGKHMLNPILQLMGPEAQCKMAMDHTTMKYIRVQSPSQKCNILEVKGILIDCHGPMVFCQTSPLLDGPNSTIGRLQNTSQLLPRKMLCKIFIHQKLFGPSVLHGLV